MSTADALGAVLAGGASRRMGRPKALLHVDGVAMVRRVADALLDGGCSTVTAVGGDPERLAALGLATVPDDHPGEGPLGGIITALRRAPGARSVLVAACDLPWLTPEAVAAVRAAAPRDAVAVASSPRREPLLARWPVAALAELEAAFAAGERAVHAVLAGLSTPLVLVPVPAAAVRNVNRPEDLPPEASG